MNSTVNVAAVICVLFAHFVGDFVFQTDWQAKNKSSRFDALLLHVITYTFCLVGFGLAFATLNGILHMAVDFVTSRVNKFLWANSSSHNFFIGIGADQFIHACCLIATLSWSTLVFGVTS